MVSQLLICEESSLVKKKIQGSFFQLPKTLQRAVTNLLYFFDQMHVLVANKQDSRYEYNSSNELLFVWMKHNEQLKKEFNIKYQKIVAFNIPTKCFNFFLKNNFS